MTDKENRSEIYTSYNEKEKEKIKNETNKEFKAMKRNNADRQFRKNKQSGITQKQSQDRSKLFESKNSWVGDPFTNDFFG